MTVIEVRRLTKRYGGMLAVDDLSFEVGAGTVTGFLGPNGAGKTTTLRALLGLVRPTAGGAIINGRPFGELRDPARTVGALLEASGFHPGRSARDHLGALAIAARLPAARVDEVLDLTDLTAAAGRRVGGFSLGMRQRLGLAAALLGDPEVLILDEPANGLDPQGVQWLRRLLRRLADQGRTVLVSSHVLAEVAQTVDDVVIIAKGRLVTRSSLRELAAAGAGSVRVRTPDAPTLRDLLAARGASVELTGTGQLVARGLPLEAVGAAAAAAGIVIHEMGAEHATLEDLFLRLTTDRRAADRLTTTPNG